MSTAKPLDRGFKAYLTSSGKHLKGVRKNENEILGSFCTPQGTRGGRNSEENKESRIIKIVVIISNKYGMVRYGRYGTAGVARTLGMKSLE